MLFITVCLVKLVLFASLADAAVEHKGEWNFDSRWLQNVSIEILHSKDLGFLNSNSDLSFDIFGY